MRSNFASNHEYRKFMIQNAEQIRSQHHEEIQKYTKQLTKPNKSDLGRSYAAWIEVKQKATAPSVTLNTH